MIFCQLLAVKKRALSIVLVGLHTMSRSGWQGLECPWPF